jgi:alginate O-acetyltransferase complex protein AlgI
MPTPYPLSAVPTFTTLSFWALFLCFFGLFLLVRRNVRARNIFLLTASYGFIFLWDPRCLGILIGSTVLSFALGLGIERIPKWRKMFLISGLLLTVFTLATFKYAGFFAENLRILFSNLGGRMPWTVGNVLLPLGLSFYSFQSMSYLIDVYRGTVQAEKNFVAFALFLGFFPKMIAGPIERAGHVLPQFHRVHTITAHEIKSGLFLIVWGLVQKVVIAGNIAPISALLMSNPEGFGAQSVSALLSLSIELYADFSGYSDIARGLSLLLGFRLVENFRWPYFSASVGEFWRRWHISLSDWCRDYIYIPLGGSRQGLLATCRNLILTMLAVGLWHGAEFHFILWGAYHGVLLCIHRLWTGFRSQVFPKLTEYRAYKVFSVFLTFTCVAFGWFLFFWTGDTPLLEYLAAMRPALDSALPLVLVFAAPLLIVNALQAWKEDSLVIAHLPLRSQLLFHYICLYALIFLHPVTLKDFVYVRF